MMVAASAGREGVEYSGATGRAHPESSTTKHEMLALRT